MYRSRYDDVSQQLVNGICFLLFSVTFLGIWDILYFFTFLQFGGVIKFVDYAYFTRHLAVLASAFRQFFPLYSVSPLESGHYLQQGREWMIF